MDSISTTRIKVTGFYIDPAESGEGPHSSNIDASPPASTRSATSPGWNLDVSKAAMTGIFATGAVAVIGGAISNYQWPERVFQISDFGPFHSVSRHLAKGILELAKCVHQIGRLLGKAMVNGIFVLGRFIASHPIFVFKMAAVGTVGYLTIRQIALTSIEENYTRKACHISLATLGALATLWLSVA